MSSPVCPLCAGDATRAVTGTVDPRSYFAAKEKGQSYVISGSAPARFDVWRCTRCGHGWTPLEPGIDVLGWYADAPADRTYMAEAAGRRKAATQVLRHLASFRTPPGVILDVGAGPGLLLAEAKTMGWGIRGLEPAAWALAESKAQDLGDAVQAGDATALGAMPEESVDALTAIDLVEHLQDPAAFVRDCARVLRSGGAMAIVTPRYDSLLATLFGSRWYCVMPAHLQYFSRRSLTELLRTCGLEPVSVRHHVRWFSIGYLWSRLFHRQYREKAAPWTVPVRLFDTLEIVAVKR